MSRLKFEEEWDEETEIAWRRDARRILNKVIRAYNDWQIEGCQWVTKGKMLRVIEYGRQMLQNVDGGEDYIAAIDRMEKFVDQAESL